MFLEIYGNPKIRSRAEYDIHCAEIRANNKKAREEIQKNYTDPETVKVLCALVGLTREDYKNYPSTKHYIKKILQNIKGDNLPVQKRIEEITGEKLN